MNNKIILTISVIIAVILTIWIIQTQSKPFSTLVPQTSSVTTSTSPTTSSSSFTLPISKAAERITKKPFGLKVSPTNSPVQPEKFSGYHTGTDFETTTDEKDTVIAISAICDGTVLLKRVISGYGGVLIQSCRYNDQPITVLYGHLASKSITVKVGDKLKPEQTIGHLGQGYSTETDGERKHLHLGIHRGSAIELKGYVPNQNDLNQWIDAASILNL